MPTRRAFPLLTTAMLLTVALLTFAPIGPVTSASKCNNRRRRLLLRRHMFQPCLLKSTYANLKLSLKQLKRSMVQKTIHLLSRPYESSEGHAPFGDITLAEGECVISNPDTYCIRWDNDKKLTKAVASKFQAMIEKQMNLAGRIHCWPFEKVDITVVNFAVRDKSIIDWGDNSLDTAKNADTSACEGERFDMSLWPSTTPGMLHEIGHGFGFPDLYLDKNKPSGYPSCVMDQSLTLTDGDGWILRSLLEHIKSRYDF